MNEGDDFDSMSERREQERQDEVNRVYVSHYLEKHLFSQTQR